MRRIHVVAAIALSGIACQQEKAPAPTIMHTDIQELSKFIQLPAAPLSAKWIRSSPQVRGPIGPNDFVIVALLEFKPEDIAQIAAKSDAPPDSEPMALRDSELTLFFSARESANWERPSKGFTVTPGKVFGPAVFAKAPYLQGKIAILEGRPNQVLVTLYTS